MKKRTKKLFSVGRALWVCAVLTGVAGTVLPVAGALASSTLECKIDFFFDKGSSAPNSSIRVGEKVYDLRKRALDEFTRFESANVGDHFYVVGTIAGEEDLSPDHRLATQRARAAIAWLIKQGVTPGRIFAYEIVPTSQTTYGHGNASIQFCDDKKQCACPNGFAQRTDVLHSAGFAADDYPVQIGSVTAPRQRP